jgi:hypothetical protein
MLETFLVHNVLWGDDVMRVLLDAQSHEDGLPWPRILLTQLFAKDSAATNCATSSIKARGIESVQRFTRFGVEAAQAVMLRMCVASVRTLPEDLVHYLLGKLDMFFEFSTERLPMEHRARALSDYCTSCEQTLSAELAGSTDSHKKWQSECTRVDVCVHSCWTELWLLLSATATSGDLIPHLMYRSTSAQRLYALLDSPRAQALGSVRTKQRLVLLQINYVAAMAFVCSTNAQTQTLLQFATEATTIMAKELHVLPPQMRLLMQASLLRLFTAEVSPSNRIAWKCF